MQLSNSKHSGLTITETLVSSLLLAIALVPCLQAMTRAHVLGTNIQQKTKCLMLARAKIEEIRWRSVYNYTSSYSASSTQLTGSYYCTVADTSVTGNLRKIKVIVGFDSDNDHNLSTSEHLVVLETLVAKRW